MAQPATKADVIQIEPGSVGTRTISRDATTGSLRFVDPVYPGGVLLSDLVGLQALDGVYLVAPGQYTTIQDALDAIPDTSSETAPSLVLVPTGVYTEDLVVAKDGVVVAGIGHVVLTNASPGPTIRITESVSGVPRFVQIRNLKITNAGDGDSCVSIDGSNTFAAGTVTVNTTLVAGDTITIGGLLLTGVVGARTPGSDDFDASLGTVAALAAEIAAAVNDVANSFASTATATAALGVVTLTAATPGSAGNSITLAASSTPPGGFTLSGATLAGGGGTASEVGLAQIALLDCDLLATGTGTRQLDISIANNIRVVGGSWAGSSSTSESFVSQAASFRLERVEWVNDIQAAYDDGSDQPLTTTSEFKIVDCTRVNDLLINFIGAGSTLLVNCPVVGGVVHNGDRTFTAMNCQMGDVLVEDTVAARFVNCTRGTLGGTGTPTLAESSLVLTSSLTAAASDSVVFDRPQPDGIYTVQVDVPVAGISGNVTTRTTAGFTCTFTAPVTGTVFYTVLRQM